MKKIVFLLLLLLTILAFASCGECEHQWSDATCTTPQKCSLCEATQGSSLGHGFGEWTVTTVPTCTANGEQTRTCKCGESEHTPLPSTHNITQYDGKPSTCTANGYKSYESCSTCSYTTYEAIPVIPHDTVTHNGKAPTCESTGYSAYETCLNCSYTTYTELPKAKHDTITHEAKAPTCTETGYTAYEECKNCAYTTYIELPITKHDTVSHEAKAPTCTEVGYEAYDECKNCNYSTYKEKTMTEHNYDSTVTPPTCEGEGYTTQICSECGHTVITDKVAPHGHTWGEWFISSQPDENSDGLMRQNCVNCDKYNTKPISEWTKVAEMKDDLPSIEAGYKVALEEEVSARYVRLYGVYNSSNRGFHLCEFGIWSKSDITPIVCDEPTNLALNSSIRKSDRDVTTELIDGEAGETSYYYWSTYASCVENPIENESDAWFEVDLGGYYDVDAITVIPRVGDHYYHWEVYATCNNAEPMTSWEKVAEKASDEAASMEGFTAATKEGTVARYLRIYGTYTSDPDYSTQFQVCEIEVWAGLDPTVEFEGYQLGNDGSSIRLIGSVDDAEAATVDLEVSVTNVEGKNFSCATSSVFKTVVGTVNGEKVNVVTTADSGASADWTVDSEYLYGYAITGIPAGTYTFSVTPVAVYADETVACGLTYTFTVTIG